MVQKRRLSVNDLLRAEMKRTLGRSDLSTADRRRLDGHFTAIRDIEVKLQGTLAPEVGGQGEGRGHRGQVQRRRLRRGHHGRCSCS